jgi:hypothetical protein
MEARAPGTPESLGAEHLTDKTSQAAAFKELPEANALLPG